MLNKKICRDCDKIGECVMKCAALKRLEIPYVIKMRGRGRGSVAKKTSELTLWIESLPYSELITEGGES